jgi:hypothetical protein
VSTLGLVLKAAGIVPKRAIRVLPRAGPQSVLADHVFAADRVVRILVVVGREHGNENIKAVQ